MRDSAAQGSRSVEFCDLKSGALRVANDVAYIRMLAALERLKVLAAKRDEKFNPNHDELGRFTTADGGGSGGQPGDGAVTGPGHALGDGSTAASGDQGAGAQDGSVRVAQNAGGRRGPVSIMVNGQMFDGTAEEVLLHSIASNYASSRINETRQLDRNFSPTPFMASTLRGRIDGLNGQAVEAEARFREILQNAIPGSNPFWGINKLRKGLNELGYRYSGPTDAEGFLYRNEVNGAEVRIMRQPNHQYRNDSPQKFYNEYYYRFRPGWSKGWGRHITIPNKKSAGS